MTAVVSESPLNCDCSTVGVTDVLSDCAVVLPQAVSPSISADARTQAKVLLNLNID